MVTGLTGTGFASWLLSISLCAGEPSTTQRLAEGPVIIGNGITNGLGATLGRFFFQLSGLGEDPARRIPIEVLLSSSLVTVEPITCSEPSANPCLHPGRGTASVAGNPTTFLGPLMNLKLASARYLPEDVAGSLDGRPLAGSSLEMALEGSLQGPTTAQAGDSSSLHLTQGEFTALLKWGADDSTPPIERPYGVNTGTGILVGDRTLLLFEGSLGGKVVQNNGSSMLVEFSEADISPAVSLQDGPPILLEPDRDRAKASGLRDGTFGLMEVNYTGFPTVSRVATAASSSDVEILVTTSPRADRYLRGDCDGDGKLNAPITDAIFLLDYNFGRGKAPPCMAACDANADGHVVGLVTDSVRLLQFFFLGGPALPGPFPLCGPEPEPSSLGCQFEPPCNSSA